MENIKVGDIYAGTWGYGMTIPAFYKVVKVTAKRVQLLEYDGVMVTDDGYNQQGYEMPDWNDCRGLVQGTPFATDWSMGIRIKVGYGSYVWATLWDGKPIWADYMD